MWSYNRLSHLFGIFNFWPKLSILHLSQFWPILICCYFSTIRRFLERFFAHNNANVVVESFFAPFCHFWILTFRTFLAFLTFRTFLAFLNFDPNWVFCMDYSPCILANFGQFQHAVVFRILKVFWSGFMHTTTLMWSHNRISHLFGFFKFFTHIEHFAWTIAFALWAFLAIFKMLSFFDYELFFRAVFSTKQL